jgi:FtsH-binding integral membrane protein
LVAVWATFAVRRGLGRRPHADGRAAIGALALAIAFLALAGVFHSEHLVRDRDPAVYITTGRSIARTHQLKPKTHIGAFHDPAFGDPDARYDPDFFPMLPVLLAQGWSVGGDTGLLLVPPLLGAIGVLVLYALASRVLGTRWGLLVPIFSVIMPLQVWFARDAYSELVVQVMVLGGLWLYLEARGAGRSDIAALSGLLVAASALARIDALAIVVGAIAVTAADWVRDDPTPTPVQSRRVVAAFGGALVAGTLVALALTYVVAHDYIHALGDEYLELVGALVVALAAFVAVVIVHRSRPGIGRWVLDRTYIFATAVAGASALVLWAYLWRPDPASDMPVLPPGKPVTRAFRLALNGWHFSRSLHWFSAYIGVVGVVVAFVGFVVLAARARRGNRPAATLFLVAVPVAVMYIARPSISADQPWAMRRYLPIVLPGIAVAVVVALKTGWHAIRLLRGSLVRWAATSGVAIVTLLVVVPTAHAAVPLVHARMQHGALAAVHDTCRLAGDDGAVLVYGGHFLNDELPDTIRAFCGVPSVEAADVDLADEAHQWHALGRRFLVVTAVPDQVMAVVPNARVIGHHVIADDDDPERVYERAPGRFYPRPVEFSVVEIPAPD